MLEMSMEVKNIAFAGLASLNHYALHLNHFQFHLHLLSLTELVVFGARIPRSLPLGA